VEAEINSGSEPWVTIDKVHPQQASPRTAHASSAEVDRYIDEEFELTKNSAREYVVAASCAYLTCTFAVDVRV
jgi:hypothetical protein